VDHRLQILLALSADLAKERDLRSVLVKMTGATRELLLADRCGIFLHDVKRQELWTIVADGVKEIRMPDSRGIAGHVLRTEESLNIPDAYADPRFNRETDAITGYRTRAILAIPLIDMHGTAIGVFQVINKVDGEAFSNDDCDLLRHIAVYAASAIESAQLYDKLRRAHEDVVYKLSHATKFKDPETSNHIIRVGLYCEVIGRNLGWTQEDVDIIKLAAPMHDIGKVGVPDVILQKPAPLDDEEWTIMKRHTTYGYEILKGGESRLMEVAAVLALEHHEKWVGGGYPEGKKGEAISIHGRMTALADVFDALTSKRHYKDAWPRDRVLSLLREERGRHFDPALDDIFLDKIDEMYAIKTQYKDE
jgi:hypothetical protein